MTISDLKKVVEDIKRISKEVSQLSQDLDGSVTKQRATQIKLKQLLNQIKLENKKIPGILNETVIEPMKAPVTVNYPKLPQQKNFNESKSEIYNEERFKEARKNYDSNQFDELEKRTLKRLRKKEVVKTVKKEKKPNFYVNLSNKIFNSVSKKMINQGSFKSLKRNLVKANLQFLPTTYISIIFFTTLISFLVALGMTVFFLFFNVGAQLPIITMATTSIGNRFLKLFWIIFVVPCLTFVFMYYYPNLERSSTENQIDQELPFAVIHMASISGSMIEPSKIFSIIISTHEYPYLEKEFTKLINEINVYGYDLVSALRNMAFNSPSKKLSELLNGLATTITSGGNMPEFFDKRAQSLLFEYRLEREKYTRTVETFMDIYISVVIAAPMIFMLLLMMMKISGLGISLSASAITLIMVLGVVGINVIFLTFLHLKQPSG